MSTQLKERERRELSRQTGRRLTRAELERRRKRRRRRRARGIVILAAVIAAAVFSFIGYIQHVNFRQPDITEITNPSWITQEFLTPNRYSRPGIELKRVNGIVVHYTANPGTDARQNRNYFESLSQSGDTYASSHFIIGIDGEIIQCIPMNEIAYCSNERNSDTISIECCHEDETGELSDAAYDSLVRLTRWLMDTYHLSARSVIRHYDITGKICPKYFVDHPSEWESFKNNL